MAEERRRASFPRGALIGAGLLIGSTLVAVMALRFGGAEPTAQVRSAVDPIVVRELRFEDRSDGGVGVYEVGANGSEDLVQVVERGDGGFLRGVLRGLARERKAEGIGTEVPFRLVLREDGALLLEDPATDRRINLQAFGPSNVRTFERLLADNGGGQR